jgi:hypothetical protein
MLEITIFNNSMIDVNTLPFVKLELIRFADFRALEQSRTSNDSHCNQSQRRLEEMKPSIVKKLKVSNFLDKFMDTVRSLTRKNSLPNSSSRVFEEIVKKLQPSLKKRTKSL